jgi:hypothetical protein
MNKGINAEKIKYGSSSLYARFWLFSFDVGQTRCLTKHSWKTNKQYIRKSSISRRWWRARRRLTTRKMGTRLHKCWEELTTICLPFFLKRITYIYLSIMNSNFYFASQTKNREHLSILRHNTNNHILFPFWQYLAFRIINKCFVILQCITTYISIYRTLFC